MVVVLPGNVKNYKNYLGFVDVLKKKSFHRELLLRIDSVEFAAMISFSLQNRGWSGF